MGVLSLIKKLFLNRMEKSFSDIFSEQSLNGLFSLAKRIDADIVSCLKHKSKIHTELSKKIEKENPKEILLRYIDALQKTTIHEKNLVFELNAGIILVIRSKLNDFTQNNTEKERISLAKKIILSLDSCSKYTEDWINIIDKQLSVISKIRQKPTDTVLLSENYLLLEQEFSKIFLIQTKVLEILITDIKSNVEIEKSKKTQIKEEKLKKEANSVKITDVVQVLLQRFSVFVEQNKTKIRRTLAYGGLASTVIIASCVMAINVKNISVIWKNAPKTEVIASSVISIEPQNVKAAPTSLQNPVEDSLETAKRVREIKKSYASANWKIDWNDNFTTDVAAQLDEVFTNNDYDPFFGKSLMYIESGGNPAAGSITGASGPFQIIKSTAERYGMDPKLRVFYIPSALTAIKILKDNDGLIFSKRKKLSYLGINLSNPDDLNTCRYLFYQIGAGAALDLFNNFNETFDSLKTTTQMALSFNFNSGVKEVDGVHEFMTPREYYVVAKKIFTSVYWSIARDTEIQIAEKKQEHQPKI